MYERLISDCLKLTLFFGYMTIITTQSQGVYYPAMRAIEYAYGQDDDDTFAVTHASLRKVNLPSSFTVCTVFMVESWTKDFTLYFLYNDKEEEWWHWVAILRSDNYTHFAFKFEDSPMFSFLSNTLYFPLQWIRVCPQWTQTHQL